MKESKRRKEGEDMFSGGLVEDLWRLIDGAGKITLLPHTKPDGDAVAACAALEFVLLGLGKTVEIVYPNRPDFDYTRQPKNVLVGEHSFVPDLIFVCDTANYERFYYPDDFKGVDLVNIDHHVSNSISGTLNFVGHDASSTCEILFLLLKALDVVAGRGDSFVNKDVANTLLFGILYDSRVFHTQATHPSTLRIAADLVECGADLYKLKCELLSNKDHKILTLWKLLLDRIEISKGKRAVWSYITQDDLKKLDVTLTSLVGFNDFLTDIAGIDVTLLFYETEEGKTKVSLRSKEYDVNAFAAKFGGGGHKNAAGILSEKSIDDLIVEMTSLL